MRNGFNSSDSYCLFLPICCNSSCSCSNGKATVLLFFIVVVPICVAAALNKRVGKILRITAYIVSGILIVLGVTAGIGVLTLLSLRKLTA